MEKSPVVNKERVVETFLRLISIDSPPAKEGEIGDFLSTRLMALGFHVQRQEYGESFNLIARKKGQIKEAPSLLFCCHMDTVAPTSNMAYTLAEGVISTTGATILGADDKAGIAQVLEAMAMINEGALPHGDLEIVFTSIEERFLVGAKNLDTFSLISKHAVILDSNGPVGKVVLGAPAHIEYHIHVKGLSAHAGMEPEKGVSAITAAAHILAAMPDGRIDEETTANVGSFSGGGVINIVPDYALIHGEIRSHNLDTLNKLKGTIFNTAHTQASAHRATVHIEECTHYDSFRVPDDSPFVKLLDRAIQRTGLEPVHVISGGGSDANILNRKGILSVNLAAGYYHPHTKQEYLPIEELYKGALLVCRIIEEFKNSTVA